MHSESSSFAIRVDVTNPGQYFACCGLLELADRLWPGAQGWFEADAFRITGGGTLAELIKRLCDAMLVQVDAEDDTGSPIRVAEPFDLLLDWWQDTRAGGRDLKVWAGTMESVRIARAMQHAVRSAEIQPEQLLDFGTVAFDPLIEQKKVEPYYFDSRRGPNAHSRDVGFSPNDLRLTTTAFPATELLCLVGLQRTRPLPTDKPRIFDYCAWHIPLPALLMPVAATGQILREQSSSYRFENWFRTGQRKHKAFRTATLLQKAPAR